MKTLSGWEESSPTWGSSFAA